MRDSTLGNYGLAASLRLSFIQVKWLKVILVYDGYGVWCISMLVWAECGGMDVFWMRVHEKMLVGIRTTLLFY